MYLMLCRTSDGGNTSGNGGERGGGARFQGSGGGGVLDEGGGEAGGERAATYAPPRLLDLLFCQRETNAFNMKIAIKIDHVKHRFLTAVFSFMPREEGLIQY